MTLFLQSGSFVCDLSKWNVIQTWCFYPYFIFSALNILLVTVSIDLFQKNSVSSWLPRYLILHISNRGITNSLIIQWKDINIANFLMLNFSPSVTHNYISLWFGSSVWWKFYKISDHKILLSRPLKKITSKMFSCWKQAKFFLFNDRERFSGALHVLYSSLVFSIKPQLQALSSRLIVNSPILCSAKSEVAKLPM